MMKNVIGAVFAIVLGMSVSSLLAADKDTMKSDMGTPAKMDGSSSEMKDSKLYVIKCGSPCDFEVKSHDKQEVIAMALNHVKTHHNMTNATEKDAESMIQVVAPSK